MKRDFRSVLLRPDATIEETIRVMDSGAMAIVLVVDSEGRLLGTVTDGDVRRGILRGLGPGDFVDRILHTTAIAVKQGTPKEDLLVLMRGHDISHIPILDDHGRVVGLQLLGDLIATPQDKENWVIILAGGLGTRLRPLTAETPKPLLRVGERTVLDILIEQVVGYGFRNFLIAVNYQAERIERHLGNGNGRGVNIRYLREPMPLGTVGAVRLAETDLTRPFLVVNGDLMTKVNFEHLLDFHQVHKFSITMAIKQYEMRIPYGVVRLSNGQVCSLDEKPLETYFVNAGIYALDPSVLSLIPHERRYDMTDLIQAVMETQGTVGGFPIHEYWLDIGAHEDYDRAEQEYHEYFEREKPA